MDSLPTRVPLHASLKERGASSSLASVRAHTADSSPDSRSDAQLIALFKTGSREAMDVLYSRYKPLVWSVGLKVLRDRAEAEDLAQDVFLELCKRAELYDTARGSVRLWILQYAYTRSFDKRKYLFLRHGIGRHSIGHPDAAGNVNANPLNNDAVLAWREFKPERAHDVCDWSILRERTGIVCALLETLPAKQREIIGLVYFQGLLMKEIAEQTGESLANVRQHYYRGLRKLKEELKRAKVL
jgi:RNA polymerase sigma-70 factor (ECF subfamily)